MPSLCFTAKSIICKIISVLVVYNCAKFSFALKSNEFKFFISFTNSSFFKFSFFKKEKRKFSFEFELFSMFESKFEFIGILIFI